MALFSSIRSRGSCKARFSEVIPRETWVGSLWHSAEQTGDRVRVTVRDELAVQIKVVLSQRQGQARKIDRHVNQTERDEGELGRDRRGNGFPVDLRKVEELVELPGTGAHAFNLENPAGLSERVQRHSEGEHDDVEDDRDAEEEAWDDERMGEASRYEPQDDGKSQGDGLSQALEGMSRTRTKTNLPIAQPRGP